MRRLTEFTFTDDENVHNPCAWGFRVNHATSHAERALARWGGGLVVLLALALVGLLVREWNTRIQAGQRQAMALASGSERLLRAELGTIERGLRGLAGVARAHLAAAQGQMPDELKEEIAGLLERNPDLQSVSIVDAQGRALWGGSGDLEFPTWVAREQGGGPHLQLGELDGSAEGDALLRTATRVDDHHWLLARLHSGLMQRVVQGLDTGEHGVVSIATRGGQMLANSARPERMIGRRVSTASFQLPPSSQVHAQGAVVSPYDRVRRISATAVMTDYPLVVFAGLAYGEVLAPWLTYLGMALAFYLLLLLGFAYLRINVRRGARRQAELANELRAGHAELALAHQVGRVGTWWMDAPDGPLQCSEPTRQLLGLPRAAATAPELLAQVHPDDAASLRDVITRAWAGERGLSAMFRLLSPQAAPRWLVVRGEQVVGAAGNVRLIGAVVDISERVQSQAKVDQAEQQLQLIFERNPTPFWVFDLQTLRFLQVNQAAIDQYGYSREEFLAMTMLDIRPEAERALIQAEVADLRRDGAYEARGRTHQRKDGSLLQVRGHIALLDFNGVPACLVLAEDVTNQVAYERELAYRATHHQDTGLLKVRSLEETLDVRGQPYTIAHIVLPGLAMVGNALGREAGEQLLRTVVARLDAVAARHGLLAFQPSEEFVLAMEPDRDPEVVLKAIRAALAAPVLGRDSYHQLHPHIGVASAPADGEVAEVVLGRAAQAAQSARERGEPVARFDAELASRFADRLQLAARIQQAIENNEFQLYFQPIRHAEDGGPMALEALLRWPQADGSFISPVDFIPLCEDTGLIVALGRWVIRAAAQAHQRLSAEGWEQLAIAVNVSAVQFFSDNLVEQFGEVIESYGLRRGALQLELTESSLMRDPNLALRTMQRLHRQGISVSLDDFGTGFSSMAYLQHLPLDSLKIDRSFVRDVETNPRNAAICRALLSLAHSMGLTVIAEGVETEGQYAWLRAHGCDQVQGYLLGRPMPLEQVVSLLHDTPYVA